MPRDAALNAIDEQPLNRRFRIERKRLNLSVAQVAAICGTTETTIFNWEAGRSRIPLDAVEKLWIHGLDPEKLLGGPVESVETVVVNGRKRKVPSHLLKRYVIEPKYALVFANQNTVAGLVPEGQVCLLNAEFNWEDARQAPCLVLLKYNATNRCFFCQLTLLDKDVVRLSLGKQSMKSGKEEFLRHCWVVGVYRCGLGIDPTSPAGYTHEEAFQEFAKGLGGIRRSNLRA